MKSLIVILSTISLFSLRSVVFAYEVPTHRELSEQAVEKSILRSDSTVLTNLGLKPLLQGPNVRPRSGNEKFPTPNSQGEQNDIFDLVGNGSAFEDDFPRSLQSFL